MRKLYGIVLVAGLLIGQNVTAQTAPFAGTWSFEGNDNGSSSNPLVAVSSVSYTGVNKLAVNPYTSGYVNLGVNVQNWSTSLCNQTEYVQFSVQPQGTAHITLTSLSFAFSQSAQGPQQIYVRSSADGFAGDIYTNTISTSYQTASITLSGANFINQSSAITFRIYACQPTAGGGTLKLDEIQINGSSLPVTLLSFTAKPDGDRVQLAWATTSEYNADKFVVERSHDLGEFVRVGEVAAKGTTYERQNYGLTDNDPQPGVNYYRLKQVDFDGTVHTYKLISATVRLDEPVVSVYPNPASSDRIHLRLWNVDEVTLQLVTTTGQAIGGRLERQLSEADFIPDQPLSAGLYWLELRTNGGKRTIKVLIH